MLARWRFCTEILFVRDLAWSLRAGPEALRKCMKAPKCSARTPGSAKSTDDCPQVLDSASLRAQCLQVPYSTSVKPGRSEQGPSQCARRHGERSRLQFIICYSIN